MVLMGTSLSVAQFVGKIDKASKTLGSKPLNTAALKRLGAELAPLGRRAASGTILGGDAAFTRGGRGRSNPWFNVGLEARAAVHRDGLGLTLGRSKLSAGPWRVAEDGRRQQAKGQKLEAGFRLQKKTGLMVQKYKKAKANASATEGFGAWSAAEKLFAAAAPKRLQTHFARAALKGFM